MSRPPNNPEQQQQHKPHIDAGFFFDDEDVDIELELEQTPANGATMMATTTAGLPFGKAIEKAQNGIVAEMPEDELMEYDHGEADGEQQAMAAGDSNQPQDVAQIAGPVVTTAHVHPPRVQRPPPNKIKTFQIPELFTVDIDKLEYKPWVNDREKMSDYFNYGFNDETWKRYCQVILQRKEEAEKLNQNDTVKRRFDQKKLFHHVLDFYLPHEFGGIGEPIEVKYSQVNTFPDTKDVPVIKPRTTVGGKNEFNVKIEKAESIQVADMSLFTKPVKELDDVDKLQPLRELIQQRRDDKHGSGGGKESRKDHYRNDRRR